MDSLLGVVKDLLLSWFFSGLDKQWRGVVEVGYFIFIWYLCT